MFGIGLGELVVLTAVGIIFLGPDRCIKMARSLGKTFGKFQREWQSAEDEIQIIKNPLDSSEHKTDDRK